MTKSQVEIITSVQRRRRWNAAEKERLVAASLEPGVGVSAVAREAGIHPSQLYGWRRQLCVRQQARSGFAAVRIAPNTASAELPGPATIDIEFASETRMRISGPVDAATLSAAIAALATSGRRR
jgi:transposase